MRAILDHLGLPSVLPPLSKTGGPPEGWRVRSPGGLRTSGLGSRGLVGSYRNELAAPLLHHEG